MGQLLFLTPSATACGVAMRILLLSSPQQHEKDTETPLCLLSPQHGCSSPTDAMSVPRQPQSQQRW